MKDRIALACVAGVAALASAAFVWTVDLDGLVGRLRGKLIEYHDTQATSYDIDGPKLQGRLSASAQTEPADAAPVAHATLMPDDVREPAAPWTAEVPAQENPDTAGPQHVASSEDEPPVAATPDGPAANAEQWSADVVTPPAPVPATRPSAAANVPAQPLPWQSPNAAPQAGPRSDDLSQRIAQISPAASRRLISKFEAAKVNYPPAEIAFVTIKDDKMLELHARSASGEWQFVHRYPVLAASGTEGPKLRQGDNQVPEGVYNISLLNPNSKYHVSMRVDYPNAFDREMAAKDGRTALGGDIMIHGKNVSKGCIAVGDEAAEELFLLAANVTLPKVKVVIAPTDFRKSGVPSAVEGQPAWVPQLYKQVASAMAPLKAPPSSGLLSLLGF